MYLFSWSGPMMRVIGPSAHADLVLLTMLTTVIDLIATRPRGGGFAFKLSPMVIAMLISEVQDGPAVVDNVR